MTTSQPTSSLALPKDLGDLQSFSQLALSDGQVLQLEFKDVQFVNSTGLRTFVLWLKDVESHFPKLQLLFQNVPTYMVRHLLAFKNSLPKTVDTTSIFVPYYCDNCDHEDHNVLVTAQQARAAANLADLVSQPMVCPKCSSPMEADVVPERYLTLLLERAKW
jgi:hypothetical protein